jgi:phosphatidylglycerol:prolipoprotein diacylglycerol transferase
MCPTIAIGPLHASTYWVLYGIAILVGGMLAFHRFIRGGISPHTATRGVLLIVWSGLAGAFLLKDVVFLIQSLLLTGQIHWEGGSGFMGALAGAVITLIVFFRRQGISLARGFDLWILPVPLGQAIGRLGCLAAGCCYGAPTDSPLGMYLPGGGEWAVRYPTQLMSSLADILIFCVLVAVERRGSRKGRLSWPFPGFIFLLYTSLYTLKRFSVEFLRGQTPTALVGPLNITHLLAAAGFLVSTGLIVWNLRRVAMQPLGVSETSRA